MRSQLEEPLLITFADLKQILKVHGRDLLAWSGVITLLVCSVLVFFKPSYRYEASMRLPPGGSSARGAMQELIAGLTHSGGTLPTSGAPVAEDVIGILKSRSALSSVISTLGLQVVCDHRNFPQKIWSYGREILSREIHSLPPISDEFRFQQVRFEGRAEERYYLVITSDQHYRIEDLKHRVVATAPLGQRVETEYFALTLTHVPQKVIYDRPYALTLLPKALVHQQLSSCLQVGLKRTDRGVIGLSLDYFHPQKGVEILDALMAFYQSYIYNEQQHHLDTQLASLRKRSDVVLHEYEEVLQEHAKHVQTYLNGFGALSFEGSLQALTAPQEGYIAQLLDIELQLEKLSTEPSSSEGWFMHQVVGWDLRALVPRAPSISGLTPAIVGGFVSQYSQESHRLREQLHELTILKSHLTDPHFDITSLGNLIEDPVTSALVQKASEVALQLKDTANRSPKEQERLMGVVLSQKSFLLEHLEQMIQLKRLKVNLLHKQTLDLQGLKQTLLRSEEQVIRKQLTQIQHKLKDLSFQWCQELLFKLKEEQCVGVLQGMEELVPVLYLHKETFEPFCKPLDAAVLPHHTSSTPLWLIALMVLPSSFLLGYTGIFLQALKKGLALSPESIVALGLPFSGTLPMNEQSTSLDTLRCALFQLDSQSPLIGWIERKGTSHVQQLIDLLRHRGEKVLLIRCELEGGVNTGCSTLFSHEGYDLLTVQGTYALEHLCSEPFQRKLVSYQQEYGRILIQLCVTDGERGVVHALEFLKNVIVIVDGQTHQELMAYRAWAQENKERQFTLIYRGQGVT